MDQNTKLVGTGIGGALVSMLCCFTPVLVLALNALGLAAYASKLGMGPRPAWRPMSSADR